MGRMKIVRTKKNFALYALFVRFILSLVVGLILSVVLPLVIFSMGRSLGYVNYANAGEKEAQELILKIDQKHQFDANWLGSNSQYVRLSENYAVIDSSMGKNLEQRAIEHLKNGESSGGTFVQTRLGKDYIILSYSIKSTYTSSLLNKYFISPESLMILMIILSLVATVVLSIKKSSKIIQMNLLPINQAVKNIQANELDFTVGSSIITEFNEVLISFQELKESLTEALEKRWESEERQRNQLAALVHDIKTPLTGVVGWTDLLNETHLTAEQETYLVKLQTSTESIEQLVNSLMQVTLESKEKSQELQTVNLLDLLADLEKSLKGLIEVKNISFERSFELADDSEQVKLDPFLFSQALTNIISNAIDFVPVNGKIHLAVFNSQNQLTIIIEDNGPGFTSETLDKAFTDSYMGDSSRTGINHFGMGLTIAKRNLELMGGSISLEKSSALGGASVFIKLPVQSNKI